MAATCPEGSFHINQENVFVESVEFENSADSRDHQELLVTTLPVHPMPFVRSRIGDLGNVSDSSCSCRRGLKVLKDLHGRTHETYRTSDNRTIPPNFWCKVFMSNPCLGVVRRFQVVYKKDQNICIRVESDVKHSKHMEQFVRRETASSFPANTQVSFEYVSHIKPKPSGKYQLILTDPL